MPLLARIQGHHSIRYFRGAARMRFQEAQRLFLGGERLGAVYLSGYVAEMILKAAYFRLRGWLPSDPITLGHLHFARSYAQHTLRIVGPNNLHDLTGWLNLLIAQRNQQQMAYPHRLHRGLSTRVHRIASNWRPDLRYHTNRPHAAEVRMTLQAAQWILDRALVL